MAPPRAHHKTYKTYTSNKSNKTNMTNTTQLKQFINGFNFNNPAWHQMPASLFIAWEKLQSFDHKKTHDGLTGLTNEETARLSLIRVEWERAGRPNPIKSYKSHTSYSTKPHGGYRNLEAFKMTEIIYDLTMEFLKTYRSNKTYMTNMTYKTCEQIEGAARSGKQNIAEGSQRAAVSPTTEIQLVDVARASQEELLKDFEDFLRNNKLPIWEKNDPRVLAIRKLAYKTNKSYTTYKSYLGNPESAANGAITLINQANYLLDRLLSSLKRRQGL